MQNSRIYRAASMLKGISRPIFSHREALGRISLTSPLEICLVVRSILSETLGFRTRPYLDFIANDQQMDIGPDHFGLAVNNAPCRDTILKCKQLAVKFKKFINHSLSLETRREIFQGKFIASGLDIHLQSFFGLASPFFGAGGEISDVTYVADTIDYRFPRENNIPHFVYRIALRLPAGEDRVIYLKKTHPNRNEQVFAEACALEDLSGVRPSYFPSNSKNEEWMITKEFAGASLKDISKRRIGLSYGQLRAVFLALAEFAAVSDAYNRGARILSNYLISPKGDVATLDSEFLFNKKDFLVPDAFKGSHEIFFASAFSLFGNSKQQICEVLGQWEEAYMSRWHAIQQNKTAHQRLIEGHAKKLTPDALEVFERQLKIDPYARLDRVFEALLLWRVKEAYMDQWEVLASKVTAQISVEDQEIFNILKSKELDRANKLREISKNEATMRKFFGFIDRLSRLASRYSYFIEKVRRLEQENNSILMDLIAKREEKAIASLQKTSDVAGLSKLISQLPSTAKIMEAIIDRLVLFSSGETGVDIEAFMQNLILIINKASPAQRKALRQSSRVVKIIFDIEVVLASSIYFDHKTLVLKSALDRHVKPGDKIVEVGPGCVATLSTYLARHKGAAATGAELNRDFIVTGRQNAEKNGVAINIVESDIVSGVEGEHDVVVWNIPFVTSSSKQLDKVAPGQFDALKSFATEEDDGTNLIKRYLAEAPRVAQKIIFASNTFYVSKEKILSLIGESGLKLVEVIEQENNTAVAFVLERV